MNRIIVHDSYEAEIYFPDASLNLADKVKLSNWAIEHDWKYIDHEDSGVTLTRREDVPSEILWRP
jgi:hypothetical protein